MGEFKAGLPEPDEGGWRLPELLTVDQVAADLRVSVVTVWYFIGLGELEFYRFPGNVVRISRADLEFFKYG